MEICIALWTVLLVLATWGLLRLVITLRDAS
jgi:hypothetical protein